MMQLPRVMVAAAHKSSGKTVISTGITAALAERGRDVAVFKKGPDYIDPMWLRLAAGRPAYNLDFNTMTRSEIRTLFHDKAAGADINLIEANKGLYDGVAADGSDSNAELAKLLRIPVVLVIDTKGMTRGIAPLLRGYVDFDPDIRIAGVILNKTGGSRHEQKLRQAVETYTDIEVLGAVGVSSDLDISERHLGLTTPSDAPQTVEFVRRAGTRVAECIDMDRIIEISADVPVISPAKLVKTVPPVAQGLRIGVARDRAFGFYYPDDFDTFEAAGAELVPIDMTRDPELPDVDGLFIGGGYPEVHAAALSANSSMRRSLRRALEAGLPAYAECGGLMYLCRSLEWNGQVHPMVGFFEADAVMHEVPQGRGHVRFNPTPTAAWPMGRGEQRAHEFHYASLENLKNPVFGRQITRGQGITGQHDLLVKQNAQAGFFHLRHTAQTPWVTDFLEFVTATRARVAGRARSA